MPLAGDVSVSLTGPKTVEAIRRYASLRLAGIMSDYELGEPGEYDDDLSHSNYELSRALVVK